MELKYISIEELLEENRVALYSFFDGGIDDALLNGHVVRCLGLIGAKVLPIKETILNINNYTCDLPDDYSSLICLTSCQKIRRTLPVIHGQITYEKSYCHVEPCMSENSYNHNEFGRYKNIHVFENETYEVEQRNHLILSNKINGCINNCRTKNYDAEIKNNQVLTQSQCGQLYMVYRSNLTTGDILIPDYPEIITWLLSEMEVLTLRTILMNTTQDVAQRYGLAKAELNIHKQNATTFWKRNSLQDFFSLKAYFNRNFTKLSRNR